MTAKLTTAFLGIEKSALSQRWIDKTIDERQMEAISQRFGVPDLIARALSARGIGLEEAEDFLNPKLKHLMPNPLLFKDMERAASRVTEAIIANEKVAVLGDYDVDGGTSAGLLLKYFADIERSLRLYVPDRMKEGYGPNAAAMRRLAEEGHKIVITVDCGATAFEALAAAKDAGLETIVLNHHASEGNLPPAYAVVNPNRMDESDEARRYGVMAAVGVTYLFLVALQRQLIDQKFFDGKTPPDLLHYLDLVALGTICDVVPLTGVNRAFVAQGLKIMGGRTNPGIHALAEVADYRGVMDTYAAGFILGPRVNAGGRVGQSDMGARLLSTPDPLIAKEIARELHHYNEKRKDLENAVLMEAEQMKLDGTAPMIFAASEAWHPGVIGIVASRLKDKYAKPSFIGAIEGGIVKGSCRSVTGLDVGAVIIATRQAGILINGGGHAMAAGFTVARERLADLSDFIEQRLLRHFTSEPFIPVAEIDGLISIPAATPEFIEQLAVLQPFGTANPEPRFAIADTKIVRADIVGEKHVSCILTGGGASMRGIAFRAVGTGLGDALLQPQASLHVIGKLRADTWQNVVRVQLHIEDAAAVV